MDSLSLAPIIHPLNGQKAETHGNEIHASCPLKHTSLKFVQRWGQRCCASVLGFLGSCTMF